MFKLSTSDIAPFELVFLPKLNAYQRRTGKIPPLRRKAGEDLLGYFGVVQARKVHREGDLPAVEGPRRHKEWWVDGKRHKEGGGPAVSTYLHGVNVFSPRYVFRIPLSDTKFWFFDEHSTGVSVRH